MRITIQMEKAEPIVLFVDINQALITDPIVEILKSLASGKEMKQWDNRLAQLESKMDLFEPRFLKGEIGRLDDCLAYHKSKLDGLDDRLRTVEVAMRIQ